MTTIHHVADCLKTNPVPSSTSFISHKTFSHWCCSCISGMVSLFFGGMILNSKTMTPAQKTIGILLTAFIAPTLATEEDTNYYAMGDDSIEEANDYNPTGDIEELELAGDTPPGD